MKGTGSWGYSGNTRPARPEHEGTAIEKIDVLWRNARAELRGTEITRMLLPNDLPPASLSEYELRGDMGRARAWRSRFFPDSVHLLIALAMRQGMQISSADCWQFAIDELLGNHSHSEPPPLAASVRRPNDLPYAMSEPYRDFVATRLHDLIGKNWPWLTKYLPKEPIAPYWEMVRRYGWLHTAVSVVSTAHALGYAGKKRRHSPPERPLAFRIRNKTWPDELRYHYVDLRLRPIIAQALIFNPNDDDWDAGVLERNLPLTEASTRASGTGISHTGLRRVDIELAVFVDVLARILGLPPGIGMEE